MPEQPMYQCSVCGLAVAVTPEGTPIRGCDHDGAGIVANLGASMHGDGGLAVERQED
jgi:hypothetical protein